jgi:cytochrome c
MIVRGSGALGLMALAVGGYLWFDANQASSETRWRVPVADADRGRILLRDYGCSTCHVVPGVPGARSRVGPPLDYLTKNSYIAGVLPNNPQNLVHWIQHPRQASPETAMPDLDVTERDARDMAAYLYSGG